MYFIILSSLVLPFHPVFPSPKSLKRYRCYRAVIIREAEVCLNKKKKKKGQKRQAGVSLTFLAGLQIATDTNVHILVFESMT